MVRYMFYKLNMYTPQTTIEKLKLLLSGYTKVNLYTKHITIISLYPDIIKYSSALHYFLDITTKLHLPNIENTYIRPITPQDYKSILVYEWYTQDKRLLRTNQSLKDWLVLVTKLIIWYNSHYTLTNPVYSVIIRKLSPYITNLFYLIDIFITFL